MLSSKPIKTKIFEKAMNLNDFIDQSLGDEKLEGKILAVTSKVVSLAEKRLVSKEMISKDDLVVQESDHYLGKIAYDCHLTVKEGLLIASAGIDESNSQDEHFILFPQNPFQSARNIYEYLKEKRGLTNFGVILTDSHTTALRRGVVGAALAYYGFSGVKNKVGSKDLFGRELQMTSMNLADSIATAATVVMGEGDECQPLAVIEYPVEFSVLDSNDELKIPLEQDLYEPILRAGLKK